MADPTTAAPTAQPVATSTPAPQPSAAPVVSPAPVVRPSASQASDRKTSPLITNPAPPATVEQEKDASELELPASTIAEMDAGRAALERNKPVALARARAAGQTPRTDDGRAIAAPKA